MITDLSEDIVINIEDLPDFLKNSDFYRSPAVDGEEIITLKKRFFLESDEVNCIEDLYRLFEIIRYWGLDKTPYNLYKFVYENKNNKLELVDVNIILPPLDEWQDPKIWGQMVMTETTQWNTYCNKSILIDINSDSLMDALCSNVAHDFKSANLFLLNKGNMQFDVLNPNQVDKWVDWLE